jgi:glycerol uptake facilitator-like aquaporin
MSSSTELKGEESIEDVEEEETTDPEASLTNRGLSKKDIPPVRKKAFLAEFLAAFLLIISGVGSIWVSALMEDDELQTARLLYIGVVYGMAYTSLLYALSSTNNVRNINPAVTLALLLTRRQTPTQCLVNWSAQILGTLFGGLLLPYCLPNRKLRPYELLEDSTTFQQFTMDFICSFVTTFFIIITCFGQPTTLETDVNRKRDASERQPQTVHELNCIICGGSILVCATIGSAVSGEFMNPFFTLCLWVYTKKLRIAALFSPLAGSVLAWLVRSVIHTNF